MNPFIPLAGALLLLATACQAAPADAPADIALEAGSTLATPLEGHLLRRNAGANTLEDATLPEGTTRLLFYFSAYWCPPCRSFTPKLVEWYHRHHTAESDWELVFVSSDHSAEAQLEYVNEEAMPWLVLDFEASREMPTLDPIRPLGIPATALVKLDGKILAHSFDAQGEYRGPDVAPHALEAEPPAPASPPADPAPGDAAPAPATPTER